jgi:Ribbon-helix-helix protein, copG family.
MMQRVYGLVDDELVHRIDEKAGEEKVSRAQWVRIAIEAYLHRGGEQESLETVNLRNEAVKLREEAVNLSTALGEKGQEIAHLKEELAVKDGEQDRLKQQLDKVTSEATQRWEEFKGFRNEITKLKKDLDEARSESKRLKDELSKRQSETEQGRTETEISRIKLENYQSTLKLKDDEISFLRAHIHQISEKLPKSLPPSQEEAKAKHWWRFWK